MNVPPANERVTTNGYASDPALSFGKLDTDREYLQAARDGAVFVSASASSMAELPRCNGSQVTNRLGIQCKLVPKTYVLHEHLSMGYLNNVYFMPARYVAVHI